MLSRKLKVHMQKYLILDLKEQDSIHFMYLEAVRLLGF